MGSLGTSLGVPWGGLEGSFGGSQGRVARGDEILEISGGSQQATHRQPVPLGVYITMEILMSAVPPEVTEYWTGIGSVVGIGAMCGGSGPPPPKL